MKDGQVPLPDADRQSVTWQTQRHALTKPWHRHCLLQQQICEGGKATPFKDNVCSIDTSPRRNAKMALVDGAHNRQVNPFSTPGLQR